MKEVKLSRRLLKLADYVPLGKRIADIGSDHALLPCYLVQKKIALSAIAGEINEGPFLAASKQINESKLTDKIFVRKGDGLGVIIAGEIDVIIIAGMGGGLIVDILEDGKNKLFGVEKLILQPNVGEELVRMWLDNNKWDIEDEEIIKEDDKIYEIIVARPRNSKEDTIYELASINQIIRCKKDLYRIGPILYKKNSETLIEKWKSELSKIDYIINEVDKSRDENKKIVIKEDLLRERDWLTEVIKCLQMGKQ